MSGDTRPLDIIIVGGGLAGLAAAGYLRAQHNVTVLERFPLNFERNLKGDYGISIVANAYRLLSTQGVKDENLEAVLFTHVWYCSTDNVNIRAIPFDTRTTYGASSVFTRRSRLQAELYRFATDPSRTGTPARVLNGVFIKSIDPIAGVVSTETNETFRGDLIIGADGINSHIRAAVQAYSTGSGAGLNVGVSEGTTAVPTGIVAYITTVPAEALTSDPEISFQAADGVAGICHWEGPEGSKLRIICYPCESKNYFQVVAYAPETAWVEEFEKSGKPIITDVPAERVLQDYGAFHPSVTKLLGHLPTLNVWRIRDIDPMHNWTAGKTILIGDAAHAITPHVGQGCNVAIEDAEALGYLFRDVTLAASTTAGEPTAAITERLALFQALRMKRAHLIQFSSRQAGGVLKGEEKERAGAFDRLAFGKLIYGYSGCEAAYKAYLAENKEPTGIL